MIQGSPLFMRRLNGWLAIFWIVLIPIALFMGWLQSVTFVSALSLWALVSGHWSAWQAARVEVEQEKEKNADSAGKIVRRLVKETDIKDDKVAKKTTLTKKSRKKRER
jgi:hypothetical protein